MKFTTALLTTLLTLTTASPTPNLSKRFPSTASLTPIYSHRWSSNIWTPATDATGRALNEALGSPAIETISTFEITSSDVNKTFALRFWSNHVTTTNPGLQAIFLFSNTVVPTSATEVPKDTSNGRDEHLGTFSAQFGGDATEIVGEAQGWKDVVFEREGRYAFSVVGVWRVNPTDLEWDLGSEGLYLEEVA